MVLPAFVAGVLACSSQRSELDSFASLLTEVAGSRERREDFDRLYERYYLENGFREAKSEYLCNMHLPLAHWSSRRRPVLPFVLANLGEPGVENLIELVRLTGEFGSDEDAEALYRWWRALPKERAGRLAWQVMQIISRTRTRKAAQLVWAETRGDSAGEAWIWIREFPEEYVPLDPDEILRTGTGWACYFATTCLRRWGKGGRVVEALLRKAMADAMARNDETLTILARRRLREIRGPSDAD
jgi:hypothetical protein